MKKQIICTVIFLNFSSICFGLFERDFASLAAGKGDWKKAGDILAHLTIDNPGKSDLLYDAGVASFNTKEFQKARAYFNNVVECDDVTHELKERTHFNLGNTCVELKELEDAVKQYESVLELNPENEKAKHNLEIVKKMLEQQKKQDQNQKQQQEKQNDQDKNNNDKNKQDKQNKQDKNNKNKDENKKDKSEEKKSDSSQKQQPEQQNNDDRKGESGSDDSKQQKDRQDSGRNQDRKQPNKESERNQECGSPDNSDSKQDKQEDDGKCGHDNSPSEEKNNEQQSTHNQNKQRGASGQEKRWDEQVMRVLAAIEKNDAQANKKMMAAHVKQAAGSYDKNQNNY